jgi:gamma-glutamyltranspeptidase/glutathione hydrolase
VPTLQIMAILERFDMAAMEPGSAEAVHIISEASRLAYADRNMFMADSDFVDVPSKTLLSSAYVLERAKLIDESRTMIKAKAGKIPDQQGRYAPSEGLESQSTTHFTIVDDEGNVVTMTSSVETAFGSRQFVRGFFLNNQLTDFSFIPQRGGILIANRVEPGKRPRSSMSPVIVFTGRYWGGPFLTALGTPGGSRIIGYVAKSLVALLDWNMTPADTVALPHHVNRNGPTELEKGTPAADLLEALETLGHRIKIRKMTSGLHIIKRTKEGYIGGADPRREGVVLGE